MSDSDPAGESGPSVPETPERDTLFELLTNHRRRILLRELRANDGVVPLKEVARAVADAERDDADDEHVRRVYISLYQHHLPKLESADVVAYEDGDVHEREAAAVLYRHLDVEQCADREPESVGSGSVVGALRRVLGRE